MAQTPKDIYSKNAIEFITVAGEYVKFIENAKKMRQKDFVTKIQKILPLVYLKASLIPDYESDLDGSLEKFVTEVEYQYAANSVSSVLGINDERVNVPTQETLEDDGMEAVAISECLADIYQDLKDLTSLYQIGNNEAMSEALWECRYNFENYWGIRLLAALSGIHLLAYTGNLTDDEEPLEMEDSSDDDDEKGNSLFSKFKQNYKTKN